nr:hypothetical protein [uncultured Desulfobacter sp.]
MIRFGLCCIFKAHPVKFRRTTATHLEKFSRHEQLQRLAQLCEVNAKSLLIEAYKRCGNFSKTNNIRTTFHPDQFVILNSPNPDVVTKSVVELEYQAQVARWVNADEINIHAGGVYNDKSSALLRLIKTVESLPDPVRKRLTLENDDRSYPPPRTCCRCTDNPKSPQTS